MSNNTSVDKRMLKHVFLFIVLLAFSLLMVLPLIWLLSASFQNLGGIFKYPFNWIPAEFEIGNYTSAWSKGQMGHAFLSSICASTIYMIFHLSLCTATGYVFAKYNFKFKNFLFSVILVTMMVPQELTFFPVYDIVKSLKAINTYHGLVLPLIYSGFGVFFMRQFALYIPNELLECSKIDGSGNVRTFLQISVPLMKPAIAALAILAFSYIWDEFAWARLAVSSTNMRTLPVVLAALANSSFHEIETNELLAGSVLAVLPVMLLFLIFQKHFIESVANAGIKG